MALAILWPRRAHRQQRLKRTKEEIKCIDSPEQQLLRSWSPLD